MHAKVPFFQKHDQGVDMVTAVFGEEVSYSVSYFSLCCVPARLFLHKGFRGSKIPFCFDTRPMTATMEEVTTNHSLQMLLASVFSP